MTCAPARLAADRLPAGRGPGAAIKWTDSGPLDLATIMEVAAQD